MSNNPYYPMSSSYNSSMPYTPVLNSLNSYSNFNPLPYSAPLSTPIDSLLSQDPLRMNTFTDMDRNTYKSSRSGERYDPYSNKSAADSMFYAGTDRLKSFTPTAGLGGDLKRTFYDGDAYDDTIRNRRLTCDPVPSSRNMYASQMIGTSSSKFSGSLEGMGRTVSSNFDSGVGESSYKGLSLSSMARPVEMPSYADKRPMLSPDYGSKPPGAPTITGLGFSKPKNLNSDNNDLRSTSYSTSDNIELCVTPPQMEKSSSYGEQPEAKKTPTMISFKPSYPSKQDADKQTTPVKQGPTLGANLQSNGPSLVFTNPDGTRPSNNNRFKKKVVFSKDNPENGKPLGQQKNDGMEEVQPQSKSEPLIPESSSPTKRPSLGKPPCKDDFVIGKKLGKGRFGNVFLVKHKATGTVFALKVIEKASVKDQKLQNQFVRQLKIQCFVTHPNIAKLYGYFDDAQNLYLIMELCCDGMLFSIIKERRRLPEIEAKQMIRHFCSGCEYLHRHNVIHRDLKLQNIIVHQGVAKICDFGWAVYSTDEFRTTVCGTPVYKPPEQIMGEKYDEKCDIWAIGILSYEVMIGKLPFKINTQRDLQKICNEDITFPQYVELSDNAKNFVLTILKKNPEDRCDMDEIMNHPFLKVIKDEMKFDIPQFV